MDKTIINELKRFVQGKMSLCDFELFQINNPEIWSWLQSLLTQDMINNPAHDFWKTCHMRLSLEANGFRVKTTATAFGFEGFGALSRIHHLISCLIITQNPNITVKQPPAYSMFDFLSDIGLECIGGKEVDGLVKTVIDGLGENLNLREKKRLANKQLKQAFHLSKDKPIWTQEPEWPMGTNSPMKYLDRNTNGEEVLFRFVDVDTGEERIVSQFY